MAEVVSEKKGNKFVSFLKKLFKRPQHNKRKELGIHSKFGTLIALQYRDKVDMSWTKATKTIIQKLVFIILKFAVIFGIVFAALTIVKLLFMVTTQILGFYMVFLGIFAILNLITVTFGLVKSLYYADDNKVLVTYPASSSQLFLSKLIVFELFEIKKSFDILIPVSLGFLVYAFTIKIIPIGTIFWSIIPLFLLTTITVLLGAVLSIPALYIYKLIKKYGILEAILFFVVVVAVGALLIFVISKIPTEKGSVDIFRDYPRIKSAIDGFVNQFGNYVFPIKYLFNSMVGETSATSIGYVMTGSHYLNALVIFGISVGLLVIVYFVTKPFYFVMMTKTFEFDKNIIDTARSNKTRRKHPTFVVKEMKLTFRDLEISGSYLCVYIAIPILLLLIDKIFLAMTTSFEGDMMVGAFNVALIILPLLASSTIVSTVYSREGRTGYIKKTKPLRPYFPLIAKILFNLVFSIIPIVFSGIIVGTMVNITSLAVIMLVFAAFFFEVGHIFFSATLDIMNPQNEVYATEGSSIANKNERISTIVAFVVAIVAALLVYLFSNESYYAVGSFDPAYIKLFFIALIFAVANVLLFFLKVKAFYIDRMEATK